MYRITFNFESSPSEGEPPTILVKDYRLLPSGVLKLKYPGRVHSSDVQFLAPEVWQNVVIEHVEEEEED